MRTYVGIYTSVYARWRRMRWMGRPQNHNMSNTAATVAASSSSSSYINNNATTTRTTTTTSVLSQAIRWIIVIFKVCTARGWALRLWALWRPSRRADMGGRVGHKILAGPSLVWHWFVSSLRIIYIINSPPGWEHTTPKARKVNDCLCYWSRICASRKVVLVDTALYNII